MHQAELFEPGLHSAQFAGIQSWFARQILVQKALHFSSDRALEEQPLYLVAGHLFLVGEKVVLKVVVWLR